ERQEERVGGRGQAQRRRERQRRGSRRRRSLGGRRRGGARARFAAAAPCEEDERQREAAVRDRPGAELEPESEDGLDRERVAQQGQERAGVGDGVEDVGRRKARGGAGLLRIPALEQRRAGRDDEVGQRDGAEQDAQDGQ